MEKYSFDAAGWTLVDIILILVDNNLIFVGIISNSVDKALGLVDIISTLVDKTLDLVDKVVLHPKS